MRSSETRRGEKEGTGSKTRDQRERVEGSSSSLALIVNENE